MSKALDKATEQAAARARLENVFPEGSRVYTILRHVSQSGMSRSISVVGQDTDGVLWDASYLVARALDAKVDQRYGGVKRQGCGMDMGFDLVYSLARALHGDGYALKHDWL